MTKKLWGGIIVTIVVIIAIVVAHNQAPASNPAPVADVKNEVVFYDQVTGEEMPATFYADKVTFTNTKLGTMTLPQAISASGARYATADESIVFWNKGDSVFITQNGVIIFNGSTGKPEAPNGKLPAGSAAPADPSKLIGTWVWQRSTMNDGSVITPNKSGAFTMTFDTKGHVGGKTDCNGYGGDYKVATDGVISMSQFVGTLMYCEGSQEQTFTGQLLKAQRYSLDASGTLTIISDTGSLVFRK